MKVKSFVGFVMAVVMIFSSLNVSFAESFGEVNNDVREESIVEDILTEGQAVDSKVSLYASSSDIMYEVEGGYIYFDKSIGTITDCDESVTSVVIPSVIDGVSVTSIGNFAFEGCSSLTSITIPEGVTSIGDWAFYKCSSLTNITIPGSVTSIGDCAFDTCSSLTSITIPEGVTSIGSYAFYSCSGLTSITIPESVTSIGSYAFRDCSNLTSITIPEGVTSIGDYAFEYCSSLKTAGPMGGGYDYEFGWKESIPAYAFEGCSSLTSITIPEGVASIGDFAFEGCSSLTSITIPVSVTSIGNSVFEGCSSLTSITIPEGVTSIGDSAFYYCSNLTSITIPGSVTSIGDSAFWGCGLTSITIPEGVASIGDSVFGYCISLTSITIPESVTSIGNSAFEGCSSLTSITIPGSVTSIGDYAIAWCDNLTSITIPESVTSIGSNVLYGTNSVTVYCYEGSTADDASLYPSSCKIVYIDDSTTETTTEESSTETTTETTTIENDANGVAKYPVQGGYIYVDMSTGEVTDCDENVTSVVIPSDINGVSVTSIGNYAFRGCSSLTSVTISEGVTSIGNGAFYRCYSLTSVALPAGVTSIGNNVFSYCDSLANIEIPESVISIGNSAFSFCSNLTSITIPESVTSIGNSAFDGCSGITSITIPEGVTSIGNSAFDGCSSLTSITIPGSVTSIGDFAFSSCSSLTSISVAEENNEYASFDGVLYNKNKTDIIYCPEGKTSVMIFEGATSICNYVFYNCGSLTSITIPEGVTSIGDRAFGGCISLTSITIPEGVTSIGDRAFGGCISLTSITISEGVTSIGDRAFDGCTSLTSIKVAENNRKYASFDGVLYNKDKTDIICCPEGKTSITIPEGVTSIGDFAFSFCNNLTSIIIPEGVISIGYRAFTYCENLTSITIPDSVTSIGNYAFSWWCDCLETVYCYEGSAADDVSLYPEGVTIVYISEHGSSGEGITIDPTCTEDGLYYESCKYLGCEEHFNEKVIPALGHDYSSEYTIDKEPTCESTGLKSRHCTRCGSAVDYTEIEKLSHTFGDYVIEEEATYFKQGVKSRVCSVCGHVEKEIIPTLDYDYENDYNYGMVTFNVVNAVSSEPVEGAQITINSNNGNTYIVNTDADGSASQIVPVGLCSISVYKNNMIMRKFEWTITAGLNEIPDIGLSSEPLIEGNVNTTVLTKTEIEDLGIDTTAPENNHIVKFEVKIDFGGYSSSSDIGAVGDLISNIITITRYENEKGEEVQPSKGEQGGSSGISIPGGGMAYFPSSNFILIVYGEAKWLKEMFDVELILLNNSATDTATECMAEINLPEGLSLAAMTEGSQSAFADMGTIPSGGLKRTHWYVRGDSAGSYNITASVNGIFRPLGDAFSYNYTTAEPVNVYAGSAMNMKITVPEACEFNEPYEFSVALTNVSDRSLYNLEYKVTDIAQYEKTGYTSYDFETGNVECKLDNKEISWNGIGDDGKISVEELKPGETITINLSTKVLYKSLLEKFQERCKKYEKLFDAIPEGDSISYVIKLISCIDARYFLSDVVVTTMEGSTTSIPWEVETVPVEGNRTVRRILDTLSDELKSSLIGDMKDVFVDIIDIESGADGDITAIYEKMKSIVDIIEAAGGLLTYEIITPTDAEVRVWIERTYDTEVVSDENSANTFSLMSLDNSLSQDYGYFTIKSDSPDAYVEDGKMVLKGRQLIEVTASGGDQGTLYVEYADGTIDSFKIATEEEPDFYTSAEQFEFDESNGTINRYSGTDSQVIIPKEINGVEVKEIGYGAFANNNTLESVVISNSVTSISGSAFSGCKNLNSVIMADTVSYIGSYAFKGCSQLKSIELPSLTEYISDYAFEGTGISKLVIPQGVKSLGYYTFANCGNLTEITVPKSVEFINKNCFINCNNIEKVYCYINSIADNAALYVNDNVIKYIGDVNEDMTVDKKDAAIMLKKVSDSNRNEVSAMIWDYNNDGIIDILDVVGVLQDI